MANTKNLEVKATVMINTGGEVTVSMSGFNNFADTLDVTIIDTVAGSGSDTAAALRVYPNGIQNAEPVVSFDPGLALDDSWVINMVFESTDESERLDFKFTVLQETAKTVGYTVSSELKVSKAQ